MQKKADLLFSAIVLLIVVWMFWEARNWAFRARLFPWTIGALAIGLAALQLFFATRKVLTSAPARPVEGPANPEVPRAGHVEAAEGETASIMGAAVESAYGEGSEAAESGIEPGLARRRSLEMAAWILGFAAAVWLFGFTLGAFLTSVAFLRIAARERWGITLAIGVVTYLFFYVIFRQALNIPFPNGLIADLLGTDAFDSYLADPIWRLITRR